MEKLQINNVEYEILDAKEKMTVADSFVVRQNKIGSANGEAKFYIGNDSKELRDFFGTKGFNINCIILKKDLQQYLKDSESEYKNPAQDYREKNNFSSYWDERFAEVTAITDILYFNLEEQTQITPPRVYVKSNDIAYKLIRKLSLPNITYLSCIKLQSSKNSTLFYFRLFVDYFGETQPQIVVEQELDRIEQQPITEEKKIQLTQARIGQGKYRELLLGECPFCAITMVTDDRLLIASHIKPWVKSTEKEKVDPKNGFMFTPTIDHLFDRGFITFSNDKKMIISPWLSKITCSRLNIKPEKKYPMLPTEGRENYLEYHRQNIFKG
jgi:putative restriction endonuclease